MNKYIQQFLDDHDLKVNEEFSLKEFDPDYSYYFSDDGKLNFKYNGDVYIYNSAELARLLDGQLTIVKLKDSLWKPRAGEFGYYINEFGDVNMFYYDASKSCDYLIKHNIVFKTEEEADDFKWFLDKVDEYKKAFVPDQNNYVLYYDTEFGNVFKMNYTIYFTHGVVYFGDEENCNNFIRLVGVERIKKYMFYLWE